ncbi:DUF1801 domain-containing protein [Ekhidna sp. To15]|uniref:DUF1801 domain-containing protein n=1 Tax=Ekhidna sp. To15 TaxID=3395267 RepID=UPI003F51E7EE
MAELKTQPGDQSVKDFIDSIEPEWKRDDARQLQELFEKVTGEKPVMWGDSIVGYGNYHYKYKSGREGDWFLAGFSPRKTSMTIYIVGGFDGQEEHLEKLGKHKKSVGCLYVKKLADINMKAVEQMTKKSIETLKKRYADYN